MTLLRLQ
jgi:hypothetical protein